MCTCVRTNFDQQNHTTTSLVRPYGNIVTRPNFENTNFETSAQRANDCAQTSLDMCTCVRTNFDQQNHTTTSLVRSYGNIVIRPNFENTNFENSAQRANDCAQTSLDMCTCVRTNFDQQNHKTTSLVRPYGNIAVIRSQKH